MAKAPFSDWYRGEAYSNPWWKGKPYSLYSEPMEGRSTGKPKKIPLPIDNHCPRCGSNHNSLRREGSDLVCFPSCSYRASGYFNEKENRWINYVEMMERKHGYVPQLRSDKEEKQRLGGNRWMQEHRDTQKAHDYNVSHRKEQAAYARSYRQKHADKLHDYVANYREQNRDKMNEYHRNYMAKKRGALKV